jgi:glycosyltransferase 2 family protein
MLSGQVDGTAGISKVRVTAKRAAAVIATLLSFSYLGHALAKHWADVQQSATSDYLFPYLLIGPPLVALTAALTALAWALALRASANETPLLLSIQIHLVSQIGKYLPGNIGHYVGRLALLRMHGFRLSAGTLSTAIELVWMVGVAAALSAYAVYAGAMDVARLNPVLTQWAPLVILALALALPRIIVVVINGFSPSARRRIGFDSQIPHYRSSVALACCSLYLVNFFVHGLLLAAGLYWLFSETVTDVLMLTSLYAIAWLGGLLLPGAPGGLGVREALLVLLLGPVYGGGVIAAMALLLRLISIAGDVIAFGIGALLGLASQQTIQRHH